MQQLARIIPPFGGGAIGSAHPRRPAMSAVAHPGERGDVVRPQHKRPVEQVVMGLEPVAVR